MKNKEYYLDSAATTPVRQEVLEAMLPYFCEKFNNPSSDYKPAIEVANDIDNARNIIASYINCDSEEIIFTSGGSESNCTALLGWLLKNPNNFVATSNIEHKSIMELAGLNKTRVLFIEATRYGSISPEKLKKTLDMVYQKTDPQNVLVSCQFANNELGVINDIKTLASITHERGSYFHTDAVQMFPHRRINVSTYGIDMMSVSGHKFGAPKGIGFLYKKKGVEISPLICGSQNYGLRGGTYNTPYIIGLGKAVSILKENAPCEHDALIVRKQIEKMFEEKYGAHINGKEVPRLSNIISVTFPCKIFGQTLKAFLEHKSVYISIGSACNALSDTPSHVLSAIGLSEEQALKTVRISIPNDRVYSDEDIKNILNVLDWGAQNALTF